MKVIGTWLTNARRLLPIVASGFTIFLLAACASYEAPAPVPDPYLADPNKIDPTQTIVFGYMDINASMSSPRGGHCSSFSVADLSSSTVLFLQPCHDISSISKSGTKRLIPFTWQLPPGNYMIATMYFFHEEESSYDYRSSLETYSAWIEFSIPTTAKNIYLGTLVLDGTPPDIAIRDEYDMTVAWFKHTFPHRGSAVDRAIVIPEVAR